MSILGSFAWYDKEVQNVDSDTDEDWEGHLEAVQALLSIFCESDSINYLRYESWYMEEMRKLPLKHPEVYQEFMIGKFVVKTIRGYSNAVLYHLIWS